MDAYVVELHDGGMRKLTNQLRLAQELLFQVFAETVDEGFEGHGAADDIVPRPFHAARGSGPDGFQGFVAAFLQRNHLGGAHESPGTVAQPIPIAVGASRNSSCASASALA